MALKPKKIVEHFRKGSDVLASKVGRILFDAGGKRLNLPEKTFLYEQGAPADCIYFVSQGTVQISVVSPDGKAAILASLSSGDFVGESSLTRQPLCLDSAMAITACEVVSLTAAQMDTALHSSPALAEYFTRFLLCRSLEVQADLVDHLFNSAEKRLARILLMLANYGGGDKQHPIAGVTHEMLAERVGTTRARITSFMNKFRRLGLIEYNGDIEVRSGLLSILLHDTPIKKN